MDDYKNIFVWDNYSDQPYPIKDRAYKKKMRLKYVLDYLLLLVINMIVLPISIMLFFIIKFFKQKPANIDNFFGMGVNLDKGKEQNILIDELGISDILIRIPLSDIDNIDKYHQFAKSFTNKNILLNILQDRFHIENHNLLKQDIRIIFKTFSDINCKYQIANAINRSKWGFFSIFEYIKFYKTVMQIRDKEFKNISLIGPSVIDFEYHYIVLALLNFYNIRFDKLSSLLYVDRRGAPENRQFLIFDLTNKIDFLYSLATLLSNNKNKIIITETNWPLKGTAPYAPTSEFECVSRDDYTNYMIRYYILALATNKIETVYWHQLVACGYGLVDFKNDKYIKTKSFYALKTVLFFLKNEKFLSLKVSGNRYKAIFKNIDILWLNGDSEALINEKYNKIFSLNGDILKTGKITKSPIICLKKE